MHLWSASPGYPLIFSVPDLEEFSRATGLDLSGPTPEFNVPPEETAPAGDGDKDDEAGEFIDISVVPDRDTASPDLDRHSRAGNTSGDESMRASPVSATSSRNF